MPNFSFRRATAADAAVLAETFHQGFATYAAFAGPGWTPPPRETEAERIAERLGAESTWCLLAEAAGEPAGHVGLIPAIRSGLGSNDPGLAHLWQLFVREPFWGTGLATELLARAVAEASDRGYERMRLVTPAGQARARRFYEREGWTVAGAPFEERALGLQIVQYARHLP